VICGTPDLRSDELVTDVSCDTRTLLSSFQETPMTHLPTPMQTAVARQWLEASDAKLDRAQRALLATIDGRRNIVELESVARAMGLAPATFEQLRHQGLIDFPGEFPPVDPRVSSGEH
jgi:hypothetical protein